MTDEKEKTSKKTTAKLPENLAKEGVGLHRKPTCVEIVMGQLGKPFMKVNAVVKAMTEQEKSDVETKETDKVAKAFADANARLLENNKATEGAAEIIK